MNATPEQITYFEELKSRQIFTVGDLIKELQKYPPEMGIFASDMDEEGNGLATTDYCVLEVGNDAIEIGNLVYKANYWAFDAEEQKLTRKQAQYFS